MKILKKHCRPNIRRYPSGKKSNMNYNYEYTTGFCGCQGIFKSFSEGVFMAYETAEEFHRRMDMSRRGVIIPDSKYGLIDEKGIFYPYTVNVNNSVLNPVYNYYFSKVDKTYGAPSDKQRIRWESGIKKFLARHFLKMYRYKLDLKNVGLQERQYRIECLEEMVAMMDPREIIKELYGKVNKNE